MNESLKVIQDISEIDYSTKVTIENPADETQCLKWMQTTNARICVGREGTGYRTMNYLRYLADHAAAMDAVWTEVNDAIFDKYGFIKVITNAATKEQYIKRPDKGRTFSVETLQYLSKECRHDIDVQIIVADGLSSYAIEENALNVYEVLLDGLNDIGYSIGTPIYVQHGRVATMDYISELLNAKVTILLVGERPGLITNRSMSCYMAYESSPKKPESQRTIISNIYRGGTPPLEAAAQIVTLVQILMREKNSGVTLKIKQ